MPCVGMHFTQPLSVRQSEGRKSQCLMPPVRDAFAVVINAFLRGARGHPNAPEDSSGRRLAQLPPELGRIGVYVLRPVECPQGNTPLHHHFVKPASKQQTHPGTSYALCFLKMRLSLGPGSRCCACLSTSGCRLWLPCPSSGSSTRFCLPG